MLNRIWTLVVGWFRKPVVVQKRYARPFPEGKAIVEEAQFELLGSGADYIVLDDSEYESAIGWLSHGNPALMATTMWTFEMPKKGDFRLVYRKSWSETHQEIMNERHGAAA